MNSTDVNHARFAFIQTNEPHQNRLMTYARGADGTLTAEGAVETGGSGDGVPHLASQGAVVLTHDGAHLLVTNAGSGDLSLFTVTEHGAVLAQTVPTGQAPKSVAEHAGLVYVLNTGDPSITGFRIADGRLEPVADSTRMLADDADPAQVGLSPDGSALVVTERGTDEIAVFPVMESGALGKAGTYASVGQTPYGFAFAPDGRLVVTEAFGAQPGKAAASSYVVADGSVKPVSHSVGNGRTAICWATITHDGRYAFTTNFADGAISRYAIAPDGELTLDSATAAMTVDGQRGLRDEDLSRDGRFLYAIDTDAGHVFGWAVGDGGALTPVGSWGGLPATAAGLAIT